jgi:alpha-glucosidase
MIRFLTIVFLLLSISLKAQLTIIIDSVPDNTPLDAEIYFAGDVNSWMPGDDNYKFTKVSEHEWELHLAAMDHGKVILFKFTRGSWETVEKGANGEEIDNRHFTFGNGDTIRPVILNWADLSGGGGGSTASDNVSILDDSFYMPQLDRNRRVWIYLPPDYESSDKSYPVLYMHDGQNLFDEQTSFAGEWEIDETLDNLFGQGIKVPIVVGIDNGGSLRIEEYTPWPNSQYGGGNGNNYVDFIIETLKPFVDSAYRTLTGRENTAIMGSSLGGLISHYAVLKYQDVFSKAGLFSPSYWFSDSVWAFTDSHPRKYPMKIYQMLGGLEGNDMIDQMNLMDISLQDNGFGISELFKKVVPNGQHNEQLWRNDFENAYLWLFEDYVGIDDHQQNVETLILNPNPADNECLIVDYNPIAGDSLMILDINGRLVFSNTNVITNRLDISGLDPGNYILRIYSGSKVSQAKFIKF